MLLTDIGSVNANIQLLNNPNDLNYLKNPPV